MKSAILLHGRPYKEEYYSAKLPSMSNAHWFPWLQNELLIRGIFAVTPEIPLSYEPLWERWVKEIERFEITPETMLVGHSCGGGFWVRYLSEHPKIKAGKVVLVAPWIDVEQEDPNRMFDFVIDKGITSRTNGITVFHSTNDAGEIINSVAKLREELPGLKYQEFKNRGHFLERDLGSKEFPELLEELVGD